MMSHTSGTFALKCGTRRDLSLLYMFNHTLAESAQAIAEKPLVYQPGEGFCYGGPSMQVLGYIAAKIAGQAFDEMAKTRVFSRLKMNDTFYRSESDLSMRISVIYEKRGNDLRRSRRFRNPSGDQFILVPGGIYSTAHDLSRFVQAHLQGGVLDGERILPESLVVEMRRNQIGDLSMDLGNPLAGERNSAALGEIQGYGLGWILDDLQPDGSARVFSHGGAWGTYIWGDIDAQLGAVLLTQIPLPDATPVWNDVLHIVRGIWGGNDN
jgi:CubicO group peptidase (beta-lactamase class C family)